MQNDQFRRTTEPDQDTQTGSRSALSSVSFPSASSRILTVPETTVQSRPVESELSATSRHIPTGGTDQEEREETNYENNNNRNQFVQNRKLPPSVRSVLHFNHYCHQSPAPSLSSLYLRHHLCLISSLEVVLSHLPLHPNPTRELRPVPLLRLPLVQLRHYH